MYSFDYQRPANRAERSRQRVEKRVIWRAVKSFAPDSVKSLMVPSAALGGDLHGWAACRSAMITVMAQRAVAAALSR